jgi:hypothetical protein
VEIYNPGRDTIDLDGWTFNDEVTHSIIRKKSIFPKEFIILCPLADTLQYKTNGKTIGLSPWPSLNNASDKITLKSYKGRLADSILYSETWYKNDQKKGGGWSLELIDKSSACIASQNWMASIDATGGTPGRQNSVHQFYNLLEPLKILNASLKDSSTVTITFNRPPDSTSAAKPENYLINNGGGKPARVQLTRSFTEADLIFNTPLTRGNTYHVSGTNIRDCAGLALLSSNNFAEFFYPSKIERGDVLISEILFNPRLGGVDFVEIYNNTSKVFDLKELSIATIKAPDSLVSKKSLSAAPILFNPKQYMVLTTDPDNIKKEYHTENPDAFLKLPSMPAFNNDKGSVVLISKENRIDQFNYTEKMHLKLIKDPKGVSLERSSFTNATNEPGNFRSAASTVGYATPGYNNSQAMTGDREHNQEVALLSKTFSPDGDGFEDALQLNYHFQDAGMIANATIYNDRGILIKHLAKNATLAINGTLVWDGLNNNDQKASVGVYIVYLEVFNLQGVVKKYRKACVLATKLN